jgi:NAD(P)-dependent dehydrogenase (short-subunit alcohol dehydrogenase family)
MGRMVFVSSGAAEHAYQGWGAYCITKAAINGLVRQLQVEEPDIMSVAISPGRVDTDMQKVIRDKGRPGEIMTKEDYASFKSAYTEGSLIKPEVPAFVMAKVVTVGRKELSGGFFK